MSARAKLIAYLVVVHAGLAVAAAYLVADRRVLLIPLEILFVVSLLVGIRLVRSLFVPLELVRTGAELIAERDFASHFVEVGQKEVDALVGVYNTMIDRLREERLRAEEQHVLFEKVVAAAPIAFLACDYDGRVDRLNPVAEALFSRRVAGLHLREITHPLASALDALGEGESTVAAVDGRRYRCLASAFLDRGHPRRFYLIEELTRELQASERAAYEKLIRMVSHEVKNSVGAVGSLLESVSEMADEPEGPRPAELREVMGIAIERLHNLDRFTNSLAELVRIPPPAKRREDLAALLRDIVTVVRPEAQARGIAIELDVQAETFPVALDKNQIERVLLNVMRNAMEAMDGEGRMEVRLERQSRGGAVVTVADGGPGLADERALFTPFYTTKREGRGIGLTLVREILSQHGFEGTLRNRAEGGAVFSIGIPG